MTTLHSFFEGRTGPWEAVIGLEVHAQVHSQAKLFDGCATIFGADPNAHAGFFTAAFPGMLPIINGHCVDQAIRTGFGLHATIHQRSVFDRKNYFYPDLPSGYQISQFTHPIVTGGFIDIDLESGAQKRINVTRLHLEMDAGKSIHDLHPNYTCIDLNRSGIALMEIVSEPEMHTAEEAMAYVKKLRTILRYLETCDGNMEQGSLRVDANISLRRPGAPLGTRAEIKNVNSIRFLGQAIEFEIQRQMDLLEDGQEIIQETRLFDPSRGETRAMRNKEDAHDYRYFPDPDLPPLVLTTDRIEKIQNAMPELPDAKRARLVQSYGLSDYDSGVIVSEREIADFYETALATFLTDSFSQEEQKKAAKLLANWLMGDVFAAMNREGQTIHSMVFSPQQLAELVTLILDGTISGKIAKDVFLNTWGTSRTPRSIVQELGLEQITDTTAIEETIEKILQTHADKVLEYQGGKTQLFGFFVGQVMKATQGKANPGVVNTLIKRKID